MSMQLPSFSALAVSLTTFPSTTHDCPWGVGAFGLLRQLTLVSFLVHMKSGILLPLLTFLHCHSLESLCCWPVAICGFLLPVLSGSFSSEYPMNSYGYSSSLCKSVQWRFLMWLFSLQGYTVLLALPRCLWCMSFLLPLFPLPLSFLWPTLLHQLKRVWCTLRACPNLSIPSEELLHCAHYVRCWFFCDFSVSL